MLQKKSPQKLWGLLFVWRSGRDSNSRPHAWHRTRLELATPCVTGMYSNQTELPDRFHHDLKTSLIFLKCGCKSTTFFWISKQKNKYFLKKHHLLLYVWTLQNHFFLHNQYKQPAKQVKQPPFFQKIMPPQHAKQHNNHPIQRNGSETLYNTEKRTPLSPPKHYQVHNDIPFTLNPSTLNWVQGTPFQKSANPPSWSPTVLQNKHKKADAFASAFIFVEPLICYTLLPFGRDTITWRWLSSEVWISGWQPCSCGWRNAWRAYRWWKPSWADAR